MAQWSILWNLKIRLFLCVTLPSEFQSCKWNPPIIRNRNCNCQAPIFSTTWKWTISVAWMSIVGGIRMALITWRSQVWVIPMSSHIHLTQSRLSHFVCNSCAKTVETMEIMDTKDTFPPIFGHNGRYITLWTRSPMIGVQEVGGSNPLAPTNGGLPFGSPFS